MVATIHLLEREGFKLVVEKKQAESTSTIMYGETIRFGLIERSRQVKPSPKPNASSPDSDNPIRFEPTEVLSVEIRNYYGSGLQKTWRDRESARLEEQRPMCVAGMMRIALKERIERDKREEEQQARQERIDAIRRELQQIVREGKKIKALERETIRWHRAKRIRGYIRAARHDALQRTDSQDRATVLEWVEWAERQAVRIDPLKPNPPSLVDDKEKVIRRLQAAEGWWWARNVPEEESEPDRLDQG